MVTAVSRSAEPQGVAVSADTDLLQVIARELHRQHALVTRFVSVAQRDVTSLPNPV